VGIAMDNFFFEAKESVKLTCLND